jgi:two-component system chemotaxis sensor kinase CheA
VPALIVTCSEQLFAISQASVLELVRLHGEEIDDRIEWIHEAPVLRLRERLLPLLDLRTVLGLAPDRSGGSVTVVVVQSGDRPFGMLVDRVNKAEEIVVKPVSQTVQEYGAYAGATVMGDGSAALILDVASIARRSGIASHASSTPLQKARPLEVDPSEYPVLTVRIGDRQVALPTSELERLETIQPHAVERSGGTAVVQYRGRMLPLVFVSEFIGGGGDHRGEAPLRVVVTSERRPRSVGLVVDQVLDVVNVDPSSLDTVGHGGSEAVVGSVVASGLVTELLDIARIVAACPGGSPEQRLLVQHDDDHLAVA